MSRLQKKQNRIAKLLRDHRGATMVEMVVSFLLLAIFLTAVTMVITDSLKSYYSEQQMLSIYSVADAVTSEIKEDIQRMQASSQGGFVKLRDDHGGKVDADATSSDPVEGVTLEFIRVNEKNGMILEQVDSQGCSDDTAMIDATGILKSAADFKGTIPKNQLTARYYLREADSTHPNFDKKWLNFVKDGSEAATKDIYSDQKDKNVVWDAENKLPTKLYEGHPVKISFSLKPEEDVSGNLVVRSVNVKVEVVRAPNPGAEPDLSDVVYTKTTTVILQNEVYYSNELTLYSES